MKPERYLIRISSAPEAPDQPHDSLEMLELVLAGVSLDLDLLVLFEAAGLDFMSGEASRCWRQLSDHDLAELCYLAGSIEASRVGLTARALSSADLATLLDTCTILEL